MACVLAEPYGRGLRIRDVISSDQAARCIAAPLGNDLVDDRSGVAANVDEAKQIQLSGHFAEASGALMDHWMRDRCAVRMDAVNSTGTTKVAPLLECLDAEAIAVHGVKEAFSGSATFVLVGLSSGTAAKNDALDVLELIMPSLHIARQRIYRAERARGGQASAIGLTGREISILSMIAEGKTDEEAARETGRSIHTIKNQVRHLIGKLGAKNRTHAVQIAQHHDLLGNEC